MGEYGREQQRQCKIFMSHSNREKNGKFRDNRSQFDSQLKLVNSISNVRQCMTVSASINMAYKDGEASGNIEKAVTSGNPTPAETEAGIKKHPQTNKLLDGYEKPADFPNNDKFCCAEPKVLGMAVNDLYTRFGASLPPIIEDINIKSIVSEMTRREKGRPIYNDGYYAGSNDVGKDIKRCRTCVTLLGDGNPEVTKDYGASADQVWNE
ncbi:hypothetical protein [Bacteroides sp.]|uniref:hypothetical protein n=1 Tax=Bacteroides sp. TaxID=29523 RepID=UPI00262CF6FC|nr:hypothetical protein [Bacteroides sp.]